MEKHNIKIGTIVRLNAPNVIHGNGDYLVSRKNIDCLVGSSEYVTMLQGEDETETLMQLLLQEYAKIMPLEGDLFSTKTLSLK